VRRLFEVDPGEMPVLPETPFVPESLDRAEADDAEAWELGESATEGEADLDEFEAEGESWSAPEFDAKEDEEASSDRVPLPGEANADAAEWEDPGEAEVEDRFEGFDPRAESEDGSQYEADRGELEEDRFTVEHEGVCRECAGRDAEADFERAYEGDFETTTFEGDEEAESFRQDDLAMEAELGIGETPFVESWEAEGSGDVPSSIASFATTVGAEWSKRRNGSPTPEEMTKWLLADYHETLEGARRRWNKKIGTGRFTLDVLGRAWMVSRRENMGFAGGSRGVKPLGSLAPPTGAVSLVSTDLVDGSKTSPVAPLVVSFMKELRRRYKNFMRAANYPGHGGGKFNGRGFSLDLYIKGLDDRGFYPKDEAVQFLQKLHEAATAVGAQWRVIYNDFSVADVVNRALGREHVIFVGKTRKTAGRVTGLNWHGPAPLILHFHLDLAPLSGAASTWSGSAATSSPFSDSPPLPAGSSVPVSGGAAATVATAPMGGLAKLEQQLLRDVQASWQRANLTPPDAAQLGKMRSGKKGYARYVSKGLFVDDVAVALRGLNLLSITDNDIDMLQRAANVETGGRLTALNSWDSAFMSVGFLQWTLKYKKLQQWIALVPQAFRRYGIELESSRKYAFSSTHGEKAIVGAGQAIDLRSPEWGVRFYMASLDLEAVIVEYRRALEVSNEVRRSIVDPHGAAVVAHYNSSPVLRALVQETHNNRPAYMRQAMKNVASKAGTDTVTFLDVVRQEIVRIYTARENAPTKAANLINKTQSRRV
jgi:hypothetical protein